MRTPPPLLCLFCAPVLASEQSATRQYYQHYYKGLALYRHGAFAQAIDEFQAVFALEPLPRLLFNIGQAHLKLGQAEDALGFYARAARHVVAATARRDQRAQRVSQRSGGIQTRAAALLAMPLRTFTTKLRSHGLLTRANTRRSREPRP